MTASIEEIQKLVKARQEFLEQVLQTLNEEELNEQIKNDKRTVAEIMHHILLIDGRSTLSKKIFYKILNSLRSGLIGKANKKPADASDYIWKFKDEQTRQAKFISKNKLEKSHAKIYDNLLLQLDKAKDKDRQILHLAERHMNVHTKQIQILLEKLGIKLDEKSIR